MEKTKTVIFCDFDGTVTRRDVGYHMFHKFSDGRNEALIPAWKSGEMSSRECLLREAEMVEASRNDIYAFLDTFEMNSGFAEFVDLCRKNNVHLAILSDGLDFYIRYLLERHGLAHVPAISNIGRAEDNGITIEFPYPPASCGRCGNCKGERIAEYRRTVDGDRRVVFIGDGMSDTCAIEQTDLLFAKKDLARYCAQKNIPYTDFDTFLDVARVLIDRGYLTE
jgi:2-hydroxy-3-keto-5-methylthiopentenyl-1-phosphate phosphatase